MALLCTKMLAVQSQFCGRQNRFCCCFATVALLYVAAADDRSAEMTSVNHNVVSISERLVKYGIYHLPGGFLPGGGRRGLKYGSSSKIREIWQP
jgi:hypothetical protein